MNSSSLRVGEVERQSAMEALGEHFTAGRLDLDEHGNRIAQAATARTWGELTALFTDLPAPHPTPPLTGTLVPRTDARVTVRKDSHQAKRIASAVVAVSWIVVIPLFFWLHTWMVFLAPLALSVALSAWWGEDWNEQRRKPDHDAG